MSLHIRFELEYFTTARKETFEEGFLLNEDFLIEFRIRGGRKDVEVFIALEEIKFVHRKESYFLKNIVKTGLISEFKAQ